MPPPENTNQNNDQPSRPRPVDPSIGFSRRPVLGGRVPPRTVSEPRPVYPEQQPPPGPAAYTPPVEPTVETPQPVLPPVQPLTFAPPQPEAPPKKPRRRIKLPPLKVIVLPIIIILVIVVGVIFVSNQAGRNKPDKVFADALGAALTTKSVQLDNSSQAQHTRTQLDFSNPKNVTSSADGTMTRGGGNFAVKGYGNAKNTYFSYQKLPSSVSAKINQAVQDAWVQLRTNGQAPLGAPAALTGLADPRYQAFGPLILANLPVPLRQQLISYNTAHHAYSYDATHVTAIKLDGQKVYKFKVKPNTGYLKIMNSSAASSEGFLPADIAAATNALDALKGTTMNVYISAHDHRFARLETTANGNNQSVIYSSYDSAQTVNEPSTRLNWSDFAPVEWQLEAQVAVHQSAAALDSQRKADLASLHPFLAQYFAQNGGYPSLANMNSPGWLSTNLPGIDPALLRDPLATNLLLAATPKANTYAYQPVGDTAVTACAPTTADLCSHYHLTATLSNGQQFVVHEP